MASPTLSGTPTTQPRYREDGSAVVVNSRLTITDSDSANLAGATVRINAGNPDGTEILAVPPNAFGIVSLYDPQTGVLTLTGTATVAQYQQVLRTVTYRTTSQDPDSRTGITFHVNDGTSLSNGLKSTVQIESSNDAPVLSVCDSDFIYPEGESEPVVVNDSFVISDVDDLVLDRAKAVIEGDYRPGVDFLEFTPVGGLTGSFDQATGKLLIQGRGTHEQYEEALRSVRFYSTAEESPGELSIRFSVKDAVSFSNEVIVGIDFTPRFVVATSGETDNYTENGEAFAPEPTLTISGGGGANIVGATVAITAGFEDGDVLAFTATGAITGTYDDGTGVLTLSGEDTAANYQAVLRSVTFASTSDAISADKTITWSVQGMELASNNATTDIDVAPVNDLPVLDGTDSVDYTEGDGVLAVGTVITVFDADLTHFDNGSLTVSLSGDDPNDTLSIIDAVDDGFTLGTEGTIEFDNVEVATFSGGSDGADLVISFNDEADADEVQAIVQAIGFGNDSEDPDAGQRTVTFTLDDGDGGTDSTTVWVDVEAVNDAPVVVVGDGSDYREDDPAVFVLQSASVSDPENDLVDGFVRISVTGGSDSHLSILGEAGGDPGEINVSGGDVLFGGVAFGSILWESDTVIEIGLNANATSDAIEALMLSVQFDYQGDAPPTSVDVSFTVSDSAGDGDTATATIDITGVNDGPELYASSSFVEFSDSFTFYGFFSVSDPDADAVSVTLSVDYGWLTLSQTTGLTFDDGDGTGDPTMTFVGTVDDVNAALYGMTYDGSGGTDADDSLYIAVDDLGNTGDGGSLADSETVQLYSLEDPFVVIIPFEAMRMPQVTQTDFIALKLSPVDPWA